MKKTGVYAILAAVLLLALVLGGCAPASQTSQRRWASDAAPLASPVAMDAVRPAFDAAVVLGKENDFIFRGKVTAVREVEVSYLDAANAMRGPYWFSVCTVQVQKVLYGTFQPREGTVTVVSTQSSRQLDPSAFRLKTGGEYYIVAHAFDEQDKTRHISDPGNQLQTYALGDVLLPDDRYGLMPVQGGQVAYDAGWGIPGTAQVQSGAARSGTMTCPADAFEDGLLALIRANKGD